MVSPDGLRKSSGLDKSLADLFPEIASQADGWDPKMILPGSNRKLQWRCEYGHVWFAIVINRVKKRTGCPYCSGRTPIVGETDLATTDPVLAAEADGWDPTTVGRGSGRKVSWICSKGHKWAAVIETRSKKKYGCPYCSGRTPIVGETDLATTDPVLAAEADGWDPSLVMAGTNQLRSWRCDKGHVWSASPNNRSNGRGCPVCANQVLLVGTNDLSTTHPAIAAEADGWDPTTIVAGNSVIRQWRCSLGHVWKTSTNSRTSRNLKCPFCGNQKVWPGFNDMLTTHPELAGEADGWDPALVIAGSNKKLRWKCAEGHHWYASASDRKTGTGCPTCASYGFDPNKDGFLYFLENEFLGLVQIGITNVPKKRLEKHRRGGWEPRELRGPMDGHLTRQLETEILRSLRRRGVQFASKLDVVEFDGWSESWKLEAFPVTGLKELIELVYEDDDGNSEKN